MTNPLEDQHNSVHATHPHAGQHEAPEITLHSGLKHPFHLVNPSPWPMLSSFAAGLLAVGLVLFMHHIKWDFTTGSAPTPGKPETYKGLIGMNGVYIGLAAVLACMFFWWRDVWREAVVERAHTPRVRTGFRFGMALFIISEVMFFAAFFWAFFYSSLFPTEAIGGVWPPKGIAAVDPFHFPFLMTMILLLSGCTVTWAHHAIIEGHNKEAEKALAITVGLGIVFSFVQFYEYAHAAFGFKDTVYASTFYMATGFHGLHVIIGTIFLAVCWWRTRNGDFTPESHFGFEAAAWYWHFVDVVWLFLFITIYWWGGSGAHLFK